MELKIRRKKEISSRFSIAWWFCHFLARRRRWCSLSGGRRLKWRHLQREKRRSDNSHRDAEGGGRFSRSGFTCVALQFLHDLLCLQVPDVNHVVLGARHDPLQETGLASPAPPKSNYYSNNSAYLPTGDREISKYAVLLVLMARVGFQALSRSKRNDFWKHF